MYLLAHRPALRSRAPRSLGATLAFALLVLAPSLARAELDCIVPTREEGFDPKQPGADAVRRAARAAAAIVQRNAVFMAGDEPVRVRTSISFFGIRNTEASVITTAYNRKAWIQGGCKLSKFADRGGGLSNGTIAVFINNPHSLLGGRMGDADLDASGAPLEVGTKAGYSVFAAGGNEDDPRVLMSRNAYRPWTVVTAAEMLAWHERELRQREQETAKSVETPIGLDEAKIETMYADMRKIDPVTAEKTRAGLLAQLAKVRAQAPKQHAQALAFSAKQRAAFETYRASLTPAQLAAPGRISGATTRDGARRVDDPSGRVLARIDPAYAKRDPNRIHVVVVSVARQPKTDPHQPWHEASLDALDCGALAALLD